MKSVYIALLLLFPIFLFSQRPNAALRIPETPEMPEWAKGLYHNDDALNVYQLDEAVQPWKEHYLHLKAQANDDRNLPSEALLQELALYKKYYKYYARWRYNVAPFVQEDGSLNFEAGPKDVAKNTTTLADNSAANWQFLGPVNTVWRKNDVSSQPPAPWQSNIYSIDVAPSDANVLYYGTETGAVGKSTDKGLNWSPVGENYTGFRGGVGAVAVHPTNSNTVYVGNGSGVHVSSDGGLSWTQSLTASGFNTNDIKIKPDAPTEVLAAGSSLRRLAGGTWSTLINRTTYDLAFKPGDPSIAYALVRNAAGDLCEFYKSTNGGQSFTVRNSGWIAALGDGGARMTVSPVSPLHIYVVVLNTDNPRILRSTDAGETWYLMATGGDANFAMTNGQGYYDLSISMSHSVADHVVVATTTAYKSTNGGVTYTAVGGYAGPFNIHPDIQEMVTVGGDSWIATDGGINYSSDFWSDVANFSPRINNMRGAHFWGFDTGWNEDVLVGGRYHNGNTAWREGYPAGQYLRMGGAESATGYVNPGNSNLTYFSDIGGKVLPSSYTGTVGSFNVAKYPNESYVNMEWSEQKWDPRSFNTYYLGEENVFWKTTNNGNSFTGLFTHPDPNAMVTSVDVSRTDPNVIYFTVRLGNNGELWKTTDGGSSWNACINPAGTNGGERRVSKVVVSGTNPDEVWWCYRTGGNNKKIYKSTDGGQTWTNWSTPALNGVALADMVHQLGSDGGIYLCGDFGKVFYRNNTLTNWQTYETGLPAHLSTEISRLKIFYKGKKLRMASLNGIWETDLFEPSTTTLVQPMADNLETNCSRDTVQLESYSVVNGPATYQWTITPAPQWISNANARNPRVVPGAAGQYTVVLTVTDDNGTTTRTLPDMIDNLSGGDLCAADTMPIRSLKLVNTPSGGEYAQAGSNLNLSSNTFTATAWVRRNGAQVNFSGLLYWRGGSTSCGLSITSTNGLRYTWDEQAGSYNFNTGFTIPDQTWTHVALVVTPTNATVYMNGVGITRTATHAPEAFDTPLQMGYDNGSRYFKGQIEEVTVWNRSLSQAEIRELMHLTLDPAQHPQLVSYYQFNEAGGGQVYDKVGVRHAFLQGAASRQTSTTPVGKGFSARRTVTGAGVYDFGVGQLKLGFPLAGPYPNGELCVSRINQAPDQVPGGLPIGRGYWVVNNFGSNASFAILDSLRFNDHDNLANTASASSFRLYKRGSFAEGDTWGAFIDVCDALVPGPNASLVFNAGNSVVSFSQFVIAQGTALPVEWLQFTVKPLSGKRVSLDWEVQQSEDVATFTVQRSHNGTQFTDLITLPAKAGSGRFVYQALDPQAEDGTNYYRIVQLDTDGKVGYSPIRSVQFGENIAWRIFPNPVAEGAPLRIETEATTLYTFALYDAAGRLVLRKECSGSVQLDAVPMVAGVYSYEITSAVARVVGKVVVAK
jgi:photosystem II stability/assembly factor-like uncharacterized protein